MQDGDVMGHEFRSTARGATETRPKKA